MKTTDKPRIFNMIHKCTNHEQLDNAWQYVRLAGLENNPITCEWFKFKKALIGRI